MVRPDLQLLWIWTFRIGVSLLLGGFAVAGIFRLTGRDASVPIAVAALATILMALGRSGRRRR